MKEERRDHEADFLSGPIVDSHLATASKKDRSEKLEGRTEPDNTSGSRASGC